MWRNGARACSAPRPQRAVTSASPHRRSTPSRPHGSRRSCRARGATSAARPRLTSPAAWRPCSRAWDRRRSPDRLSRMSEAPARLEIEDLQESLRAVQELIADGGRGAELRARLDVLHPADIAYLLEALPPEQRLAVWERVKADRDGEILVEVSEAVRESLIASMDSKELVAAAETLP